jgi:hypothetical protein
MFVAVDETRFIPIANLNLAALSSFNTLINQIKKYNTTGTCDNKNMKDGKAPR